MRLKLIREEFTDKFTKGSLYINGYFFAYTLEDRTRDLNMDGDLDDPGEGKVKHETSIPYGTYKVILNHSPKFKVTLPLLLNVKHFEGIRIHNGISELSTSGCILIGYGISKDNKLFYSKAAVRDLIRKMKDSKQDEWEIEIV